MSEIKTHGNDLKALPDVPDPIRIRDESVLKQTTGGSAETSETAWAGEHSINVRISFPLGFGRYYLTLVAGKERRSDGRRKDERQRHPLITAGNMAFFFAIGSLVGLSLLALMNMLAASVYAQ